MDMMKLIALAFVFFPLVIGALNNKVKEGIIYSSVCLFVAIVGFVIIVIPPPVSFNIIYYCVLDYLLSVSLGLALTRHIYPFQHLL